MSGLDGQAIWNVAAWGSQLFAGALGVALPGMTALLVVNIAFGVMSRAAPTLNLFAVGFPVTLIAGLLIVYAGLPTVQASFVDLIENAFDFVRALQGGG
jgi:flagellar biosynthetic protein FliR